MKEDMCRYIDRIANVKWELKDLGMEHNGYVYHPLSVPLYRMAKFS